MGNEQSQPLEGPPEVLETRDLHGVVKYLQSAQCKRVFVMLGAGVSTAAGIPDFRSPDTGLYANLARLNLPYPEAVFEINFFRDNPAPFYALARELMPGKFRPTLTHSFVNLLAKKSLLNMCYTQNIDTLERLAGVPESLIVEAHGSFANQHCIDCGSDFDGERLRGHFNSGVVAQCEQCDGLVKPDIVFFGESLPPRFAQTVPLLSNADLLFVLGTSLTVHPFASLASRVPDRCPRVLINLDKVGDFGTRPDDVVLLGKTDEVVRRLCRTLGWEDELDNLWKETEGAGVELTKAPEEKPKEDNVPTTAALEEPATKEQLKEAVDRITTKVEVSLKTNETAKEVERGSVPAPEEAEPEIEALSAAIEKSLTVADAPPRAPEPDTKVEAQIVVETANAEGKPESLEEGKALTDGKL